MPSAKSGPIADPPHTAKGAGPETNIIPFPAQVAPLTLAYGALPTGATSLAPLHPARRCRITQLTIHDVARRLNIVAQDMRTITKHIRAHILHEAMPAPVSSRLIDDKPVTSGPDAVHARALWDRDQFDLWLDERMTQRPDWRDPAGSPSARAQLAADLAERASQQVNPRRASSNGGRA